MNCECTTFTIIIDKNLPNEIYILLSKLITSAITSAIIFGTPYCGQFCKDVCKDVENIRSFIGSCIVKYIIPIIPIIPIIDWYVISTVIFILIYWIRVQYKRMKYVQQMDQFMIEVADNIKNDMDRIVSAIILDFEQDKKKINKKLINGQSLEDGDSEQEEKEEKEDPTYNPDSDLESDLESDSEFENDTKSKSKARRNGRLIKNQ